MPWRVLPVSEQRSAFVHLVLSDGVSMARACRRFAISRKTGYKWLARWRAQGGLEDLPRRPLHSPRRTSAELEEAILQVRDRYGWGARKIFAFLTEHGLAMPSIRTVGNILSRRGRIGPAPALKPPMQPFERGAPNELWQLDFKGPLELCRRPYMPFSILDDHSRYCLALRLCRDVKTTTAWDILWETFAQAGLPREILCDGGFRARGPAGPGLCWFEGMLIRVGVRPVHGRPYHPQTQGKVERFHGSIEREFLPRACSESPESFAEGLESWRQLYNFIRPHQAIGDVPPVRRWSPSPRRRPERLPEAHYPDGSTLRKVSTVGDVRYKGWRILVGRGVSGQMVRIEQTDSEVHVYYCWKLVRRLAIASMERYRML